jgi:hypothetical protein
MSDSSGNNGKGITTTVEQQLQRLVEEARAQGRAEAVREWQEKFATFAAEFVQRQMRVAEVKQPLSVPIAPPSIAPSKPLSPGKMLHPHCEYPGCSNPNNGPKYRWLCRDHRSQWKTVKKLKKQAAREATRAQA